MTIAVPSRLRQSSAFLGMDNARRSTARSCRPVYTVAMAREYSFPVAPIAAFGVALAAASALTVNVAQAGVDLALGEQVFSGNCAACHTGGGNTVLSDHTLQKAAIEKYLDGGLNISAIVYQVQNGKNAMPAWADRLDEDEIDAVANYVYDQAANNKW